MDLEACLPPHLRGPTTTITRVAAGLSGAGVYRVEAAGGAYGLKVSGEEQPPAEWPGHAPLPVSQTPPSWPAPRS